MSHFHVKDKLVVITGAGSGIGRECALSFARREARLALLDLNWDDLESLQHELAGRGSNAGIYSCDVTDAAAVAAASRQIEAEFGPADILINNAGIGYLGKFLDTGPDAWQRVMNVNVMGVVHCLHAFLPSMLKGKRARAIVNIASTAGFAPAPSMSAYAASKHAVVGLSEVLAMELADKPVNVLIVAPGIINTNIVKNPSGMSPNVSEDQIPKLQSYYRAKGCLPDVVAEAIVKAVQQQRHLLAVGPSAKLLTTMMRLSRRLTRRMTIAFSKDVGFL